MRTAIMFAGLCIADAIRKDWIVDKGEIKFIACFVILFIIMDITEFIKKLLK